MYARAYAQPDPLHGREGPDKSNTGKQQTTWVLIVIIIVIIIIIVIYYYHSIGQNTDKQHGNNKEINFCHYHIVIRIKQHGTKQQPTLASSTVTVSSHNFIHTILIEGLKFPEPLLTSPLQHALDGKFKSLRGWAHFSRLNF